MCLYIDVEFAFLDSSLAWCQGSRDASVCVCVCVGGGVGWGIVLFNCIFILGLSVQA